MYLRFVRGGWRKIHLDHADAVASKEKSASTTLPALQT
jgi:hypothetical protein